jgi:hypothetical protein
VWLEPKAKRIVTGDLPAETIELALAVGLPRVAARARRRELLIELIDGVPAGESPLARVLLANHARADYHGLVVRALPQPPPGLAPVAPPPRPPTKLQVAPPPMELPAANQVAPPPEAELDGLDFESDPDDPDAEIDPAELDPADTPDADGDFDADA